MRNCRNEMVTYVKEDFEFFVIKNPHKLYSQKESLSFVSTCSTRDFILKKLSPKLYSSTVEEISWKFIKNKGTVYVLMKHTHEVDR